METNDSNNLLLNIDGNKKEHTHTKMLSKNKRKNSVQKNQKANPQLTSGGHALSALGSKTAEIAQKYLSSENGIFSKISDSEYSSLSESFKSKWTDENSALLLSYIFTEQEKGSVINITSLNRWILSHPDEVQSVIDCMNIKPPKDFQIIKVLSRAGSQKLVFLAQWTIAQKQVVLKALKGDSENSSLVIERESQAHPFNLNHDNIIETHIFQNEEKKVFLVEEKLSTVLNDNWRADGLIEAANLLHDIAKALSYLHERLGKVHGDVKPDNIGKKDDDYILLDFGICRSAEKFQLLDHPSGSLRTRAPELLLNNKYEDAFKADIWALGATIFNTLYNRFPLYDEHETPPRGSNPKERTKFEEELMRRINSEWSTRVIFNDDLQSPIVEILKKMLEQDPKIRICAKDLVEQTSKQLAAFIRNNDDSNKISPIDELNQLKKFLPTQDILKYMPSSQKEKFKNHLEHLKTTHALPESEQNIISELSSKVN